MKYTDQIRSRLWLAATLCGLAGLFYVYDYFIQVSPSVITDELMQALSVNVAQLGTVLASFSFVYVLMQIPAGMLLSKYGVRRIFSLMVVVSSLGVFLFSSAHNPWTAAAGRGLIGAGAAFAFLGVLNLAAQWLPHRYFSLTAGIVAFAGCLGSIAGQAPMSHMLNYLTWREVFFYAGILCLILSVIYWLTLRDNKLYLPKRRESDQWVVLRRVLRNKQAWYSFLLSFCAWASVGGFAALWAVPYLVRTQGLTTTQAGSHLIWFWLALGLGSPIFGYITAHVRDITRPTSVCFFMGILGFIGVMWIHPNQLWWLDISLLLLGSASSGNALSFGVLKNQVTKKEFGTASGINNLAAILAAAMLQVAGGFILHALNPGNGKMTASFSTASYMLAFAPVGLFLVIGFLTSVFLLNGKTRLQD